MSKKLTSIVLALMMVLSVMTVGVVSVGAKPIVPVIDLPEWEWVMTETSTGDTLCILDETEENDTMGLGMYISQSIRENVNEVTIELYHFDFSASRPVSSLVFTEHVNLAEMEATSVSSEFLVTSYVDGVRDEVTFVYSSVIHYLYFDKDARCFEVNSNGRVAISGCLFVNKDFMDNLYHDRIVEECGEPISYADWINAKPTQGTGDNRLDILVSEDGENWYKLLSFNSPKATVVGMNSDTYSLGNKTMIYWDNSILGIGSKYWMMTEGFTQDSNTKVATPIKPLANGVLTWYSYAYGLEVTSDSTASELYDAYVNAPDEYKVNSLNKKGNCAIELNTPESETSGVNYIMQSGSSEQSIVTLDYNTANLKATVPTVLPVNVDSNNNVTVADNAQINNLSNGSVDVTNAEIQTDEWSVVGFNTDFTKVPVDTKQYSFKLNGDDVSDGVNTSVFNTINGNNHIGLSYDANVAIQSQPITNEDIGRIVFTVAWHK